MKADASPPLTVFGLEAEIVFGFLPLAALITFTGSEQHAERDRVGWVGPCDGQSTVEQSNTCESQTVTNLLGSPFANALNYEDCSRRVSGSQPQAEKGCNEPATEIHMRFNDRSNLR